MSDFQVRSDAVDVEQIMEQIRRRIRDKRGVDYTEAQVRELANVRLEKFLDPKNLRSDLLEQFRKSRPADDAELPPPTYEFEDTTLYDTHRGLLRTIRRWLNPLLKLFFNPNMIVNVLHQQANLNRHFVETTTPARVDRAAWKNVRAGSEAGRRGALTEPCERALLTIEGGWKRLFSMTGLGVCASKERNLARRLVLEGACLRR